MDRSVPLWLVLLLALLGLLFLVAFGAAVRSDALGGMRGGAVGAFARGAGEVAAFPATAKDVFEELRMRGSESGGFESLQFTLDKRLDLAGFQPMAVAPGLGIHPPLIRADPAALTPGWRVLVGVFEVNAAPESAAVLVSPDLRIVKKWSLDEVAVGETQPKPPNRKFVHGTDMGTDGSIYYTFHNAISLTKKDACEKRAWVTPGASHHAVTLDEGGASLWTFDNDDLRQVATDDGRVLRTITMKEVIDANPEIDLLEIRTRNRRMPPPGRQTNEPLLAFFLDDPFHLNDVDPLPPSMAAAFPQFAAGDLLVSMRELNLVLVLEPETRRIKWWRVGAWQRQHDPDWLPDGRIALFDNRMRRGTSRIVAIDPKTYEVATLVDGNATRFFSAARGMQQLLPNGHVLVSSANQGRIFETDEGGRVLLDIVNRVSGGDAATWFMSQAIWFPADSLNPAGWACPPAAPR
jgi:hypothetical protein